MRGLNGVGKIWPLAIVAVVAAVIATRQWILKADVLTYGNPAQTFFKPGTVIEGDEVELCFGGIVWSRLCEGKLVTHFTPSFGPRIDLPSYTINTPLKRGPVELKCRKMTAPLLAGRQGPLTLNGYASFHCGDYDRFGGPDDVMLSPVKLNVDKRK